VPYSLVLRLGGNSSLGIGEMKISTAAPHLGFDPSNLTSADRRLIAEHLRNPDTAIRLVAMEIARLKAIKTPSSLQELGTAYNYGKFAGEKGVGTRSRGYESVFADLLRGASVFDNKVVRCNGGYKFERQCK
jgi:hypothetical protein